MSEPGVGRVVAERYLLEARLGAGGFGQVWRALDLRRGRAPVALKLPHPALLARPAARSRFQVEAEALQRLEHPGILGLLDHRGDGPEPYLATELGEGRSLREVIMERAKVHDPFTLPPIAGLLTHLGEALAHAHCRAVVHRDPKPGNVLVTFDDDAPTARIIDFGLAKLIDETRDGTTVGRLLGTPLYLSPEQIRGLPVDARTDLFALATLTFELFTLRWAWARDWEDQPLPAIDLPSELASLNHPLGVTQRITTGLRPKVSPWRELPGALVPKVDRVLAQAMSCDPADRPLQVQAWVDELTEVIGRPPRPTPTPSAQVPTDPTIAASPGPPPRPRPQPRVWLPFVAAACLAAGAATWWSRDGREPGGQANPVPGPGPSQPAVVPEAPPHPRAQPHVSAEAASAVGPDLAGQGRASSQNRRPEPAPPPKAVDEVQERLQVLLRTPDDHGAAEALSQAIRAAGRELPRAEDRTTIERCATYAMMPVNVERLEACVASLKERQ